MISLFKKIIKNWLLIGTAGIVAGCILIIISNHRVTPLDNYVETTSNISDNLGMYREITVKLASTGEVLYETKGYCSIVTNKNNIIILCKSDDGRVTRSSVYGNSVVISQQLEVEPL